MKKFSHGKHNFSMNFSNVQQDHENTKKSGTQENYNYRKIHKITIDNYRLNSLKK